jgi:hypothetical protein
MTFGKMTLIVMTLHYIHCGVTLKIWEYFYPLAPLLKIFTRAIVLSLFKLFLVCSHPQ